MYRSLFFILFFLCSSALLFAQRDTTKPAEPTRSLFGKNGEVQLKDSTKKVITDTASKAAKLKHDPRKATFRSAVLPGWGQAYNHEYWKIPIVYGALAIPASLYVYNSKYYKLMKFAYQARYLRDYGNNDSLVRFINPKLRYTVAQAGAGADTLWQLSTYQNYRNSFKRNKDYSLLYFLLMWGLNVADATVFGHLKEFDVSDDLSLEVNPSYVPSTKTTGVSLVLSFKDPARKPLPLF